MPTYASVGLVISLHQTNLEKTSTTMSANSHLVPWNSDGFCVLTRMSDCHLLSMPGE